MRDAFILKPPGPRAAVAKAGRAVCPRFTRKS